MVALSNVQFGKRNEDVRTVQKALIKRGHKIPDGATGLFGEQTRAAYRAEQLAQGFKGADADGKPGLTSLTTLGHFAHFTVEHGHSHPPAGPSGKGHVASPVPGHKVTFQFFERGDYAWKPDGVGRHTGQDFAANSGVPVVAVRGGTIAWSNGQGGAYGQWIGLRADNGHIYTYCHLSQRQVKAGQRVTAGQQLGKVGTTGNSTGPHLHFEMSKGSSWSYGNVAKPRW
ncbi:peptidoglycan DD-metalloendopeptidase family protein [Streptomyces sp. NBC_00663]|uniref:peptidoglycan DD-metalloendopeptidase family protein n=1 Tax=Streptomyces sp. NBC_00663 TaxID=2975801 RepID=UPI002E36CF15|nr:peptidoglycan DD-metalloendopeptidase family protein [Streptomyces sp. NBC_00663]